MATLLNGQNNGVQNFSVDTVRNLLRLDNRGIAKLCAQVSLMPKKDRHGRTYFSRDDMEILSRVRNMQAETKSVKAARVTNPIPTQRNNTLPIEKPSKAMVPAIKQSSVMVEKIVTSLETMETSITDKISKLIDEKLDGMDEVVVELVRCKTELETLRYKMNEMSKENYNLKNDLSKFKSLGLGFYVKKSGESIL